MASLGYTARSYERVEVGWPYHSNCINLFKKKKKKATLHLYLFKTVSQMSMLDSTCDPPPVSRVTRITGTDHQTEPQGTILKRKEPTSKTPVGFFFYKFIGVGGGMCYIPHNEKQ